METQIESTANKEEAAIVKKPKKQREFNTPVILLLGKKYVLDYIKIIFKYTKKTDVPVNTIVFNEHAKLPYVTKLLTDDTIIRLCLYDSKHYIITGMDKVKETIERKETTIKAKVLKQIFLERANANVLKEINNKDHKKSQHKKHDIQNKIDDVLSRTLSVEEVASKLGTNAQFTIKKQNQK